MFWNRGADYRLVRAPPQISWEAVIQYAAVGRVCRSRACHASG